MRNIGLLGIAIFLGSLAYIYEELGEISKQKEKDRRGKFFTPEKWGKIVGLSTPKIKIAKKGTYYYDLKTNQKISESHLHSFLKEISTLRIQKSLQEGQIHSENRQEFFPDENQKIIFSFEKETASLLLGNKLNFAQSFYLEVTKGNKTRQIIAYDTKVAQGVYKKNNAHRHSLKYQRLKGLYELRPNDFYE